MMTVLLDILKRISDHSDALLGKAIHHFGVWIGVVGGAGVNMAGKALQESEQSHVIGFVLEWGGLVSMLAAGTLILKNLTDMVLAILRAWWDRQEQKKRMNEDD